MSDFESIDKGTISFKQLLCKKDYNYPKMRTYSAQNICRTTDSYSANTDIIFYRIGTIQ